MRNPILVLSFIMMAGTMLINCQSSVKQEDETNYKAQDTLNYLADNQSDSIKTLQDTTSVYQKFITESENRINTYEIEIAEFFVEGE